MDVPYPAGALFIPLVAIIAFAVMMIASVYPLGRAHRTGPNTNDNATRSTRVTAPGTDSRYHHRRTR